MRVTHRFCDWYFALTHGGVSGYRVRTVRPYSVPGFSVPGLFTHESKSFGVSAGKGIVYLTPAEKN